MVPFEDRSNPDDIGNNDSGSELDPNSVARALYEEAGVELPDWLQDQPSNDDNAEDHTDKTTGSDDTGSSENQPPSPQGVNINGRILTPDEASTLLGWRDFLAANPEKADRIIKIARGDQEQEPTQSQTVETKLPDGFDPDDPVHKFFLSQLTDLSTQVHNLSKQSREQLEESVRARARNDFDSALTKFRTTHPDLSDDDISKIRAKTAELGITDTLVRQSQRDPVAGITKALEYGMWNLPDIRDRSSQPSKPDATKRRQSKLSALSGSSGSTTRSEPRPRLDSDQAMKDAIAKAVAPMFSNSNN